MFTGIIDGFSIVSNINKLENFQSFSVLLNGGLSRDLNIGASVSIDGVCMTVSKIDGEDIYFDAMKETLERTTLGLLEKGSNVNIERSLKYANEIGGHIVSGHVHGKAQITKIDKSNQNNCVMYFRVPERLIKYLFPKGFVSLNGASLTVVDVDTVNKSIKVSFIPETLRNTTFGLKKINEDVNLEIDSQTQSIVDTVERYLNESKITS
ncbi:riboflavin synthase [Candidatus Marithrix sp. Canyon 246]|uniref:riboflavin synthase n=1 Tax=Candidatus Marithrix sp. Canyon 246 TaxID=1827136 RepID=UPI000849F4E0|nr:riboflavin synthase [Candidatus Marithrix sp. Canyon 246]